MKRFFLFVIAMLAAAAMVIPAGASAHESDYLWSSALCKHRLVVDDIEYDDGRDLDVVSARCFGYGQYEWNDYGTRKLYKHFVTLFQGSGGTWRCGTLHVTSRSSFVLTEIRLASICANGG
jgi:hypothetical protein